MITKTDLHKGLLSLLLFLLFLRPSYSQLDSKRAHLEVRAGITTGSPIVVKNIPSDATGKPGIGLNAGLEYTYIFHPRWSMTIGAAYAKKGSSFTSPVSGKYDATRGVFGERFPFPLRVKYTGTVAAGFDMTYLDFPVLINIHLKKWWIGVGYQYSKMLEGTLDGSVDVKALLLSFNDQAFDESANMKDYDHAGILKIGRQLNKRISFAIDFTVSAQQLLIETEEGFSNPRNLFINALVGYRLF